MNKAKVMRKAKAGEGLTVAEIKVYQKAVKPEKHVYDLTVLLDNEQIEAFLQDKKRVLEVIGYKRKEELNRKGGVAADMQIANFDYFRGLDGNKEFEIAFDEMQRIYVFNEQDKLSRETVSAAISKLREIMDIEWDRE